MTAPELPDCAALLLDVDGTLLDIAPTPDAVVVPPDLLTALRALRGVLGDAVAVVSGRPVEQIEALLEDAPYAVAGEHGGAIRYAPGAAVERADLPALPVGWLEQAERAAAAHPGGAAGAQVAWFCAALPPGAGGRPGVEQGGGGDHRRGRGIHGDAGAQGLGSDAARRR